MRSVAVVKRFAFLIIFLGLFTAPFVSARVSASDTTVRAQICNPSSGSTAQITITSPIDDSVITQNSVTLTGTLTDITQIDVLVDGIYDQTIAVSGSQTTYSAVVNLAPGTHTINVSGNDICNLQDPAASVVVTYQPNTQPTTGSQTPTSTQDTPGGVSDPGQTAQKNLVEIPDVPWFQQLPGYQIAATAGRALDFDVMAKDGMAKAILRFAFFTLGLLLLILAPLALKSYERGKRLHASVVQYVGNKAKVSGKAVSHIHRNVAGVRILGLILGLYALII